MDILTADQFIGKLKARHLATQRVDLPDVGGAVHVRELPPSALSKLEKALTTEPPRFAEALALLLANQDGTPMFTPEMNGEASVLQEKLPPKALKAILEAGQEINATTQEDIDEMQETLEKNPTGRSAST